MTTAITTAKCLVCDTEFEIQEDWEKGEITECTACGQEHEVVEKSATGVRLDLAPEGSRRIYLTRSITPVDIQCYARGQDVDDGSTHTNVGHTPTAAPGPPPDRRAAAADPCPPNCPDLDCPAQTP